MRKRCFISALVCASFFLSAPSTAQVYGDIEIEWEPVYSPARRPGIHGYGLHRFKVVNRSASKTRQVAIQAPADHMRSGARSIHSVSNTAAIPPQTTMRIALFQPPYRMGGGARVFIDGNLQDAPVAQPSRNAIEHGISRYYRVSENWAAVSRNIKWLTPRVLLNEDIAISTTMSGGPRTEFVNGIVDESNWLAYTPYHGVVITLEQAKELNRDQLIALRRYVECGGSLAVEGIWEEVGRLPDSWAVLDSRFANRAIEDFEKFEIGFGVVFLTRVFWYIITGRRYGKPYFATVIPASWHDGGKAWWMMPTMQGANAIFPITKEIRYEEAQRRMFYVMLLAALLIGPLHIYVVHRKKRLIWVYWTTPLLSALICLGVVLFAATEQGRHKQMRVASVTFLDQSFKSAATIGWIGFYSPMTSVQELRFESSTELTPLLLDGSGPQIRIGASVGSIDWTDGQRLTGGWVQAGIPRHFKLRKNEDRPERIDLKRDGGDIKIVNRLGARVKTFWYADHDGKIYQAADIPNEAEAVLTETKGVKVGLKKLRDVYASQDWVAEIEAVKASPAAHLQPGRYFAELEENVFVEKALKGAKMKSPACLVVGKF